MTWTARGMRALACASLACASLACKNLTEITPGVCGNRVVDKDEACDFYEREGVRCRAPGEAQQCQLDCSVDAESCPADSGCDLQLKICRPVTGRYVAVGKPVTGNAFSLRAGDIDGDQRSDLLSFERPGELGAVKFRLLYFDQLDKPPQTLPVPMKVLSVDVVSPDAASPDRNSDLVYANGRLGLMLGQPDRSLLSQTYPTYFLADTDVRLTGSLYKDTIDHQTPLVILAARENEGITLYMPGLQQLVKMAELPGRIEDLTSEPTVGELLTDPAHPCSELVFALRGAHELRVYSICTPRGSDGVEFRDQAELLLVPFEAGVQGGPLITDVDGDGKLDLIVASASDLYVAWGDGTSLSAPERYAPSVTDQTGTPQSFLPSGIPLAAGDFNGDGKAELVYPKLILLSHDGSRAGASYQIYEGVLGSSWSSALIADLNHNALNDVVLASRDSLDLEFLNGTGQENAVISFVIPTERPVERLAVADLDGDMIQDLVFSQVAGGEDEQDIAVSFGREAGPPANPTIAARVPDILQIGTLLQAPPLTLGQLFVAYRQTDSGGVSGSALAWLGGGGDRSLVSNFDLTSFQTEGLIDSALALVLKTGHYRDPQRLDLLVVGIGADDPAANPKFEVGELSFWLVPDLSSSRGRQMRMDWALDPRLRPLPGSSGPRVPGEYPELNILLSAADLDGDLVDELLIAAPDESGQRCLIASAELIMEPVAAVSERGDPLVIDAPCDQDSQLGVDDLDGDAALDIVLLTGSPGQSRRLLVFWNDGRGQFSTDAMTEISGSDENAQAFALYRQAKGSPLRLAYVTSRELRLLQTASGIRDLGGKSVGVEIELAAATGLAAADLDGDRVTDLAIADQGAVKVLQAELGTEWPF